MQESFKIVVPEGMEIDKDKSTFECIIFKKKENILPKSWEELEYIEGYYVNGDSDIKYLRECDTGDFIKNIFPTKELAEASLAIAQLTQLCDRYNDGWVPDWTKSINKYIIQVYQDKLEIEEYQYFYKIMNFKTPELRDLFFENFKELLEIAKPLL